MRAVRKETSKPDLKVFPDISDNPLSYPITLQRIKIPKCEKSQIFKNSSLI